MAKSDKILFDFLNRMDNKKEYKKDCKLYPYIDSYLPAVKRIIVIGDIHSDYDVMIKSLLLANIINDKDEWIAVPKDTIVVQVGDQLDGCRPTNKSMKCATDPKATFKDEANDLKIMKYLTELDTKARSEGGRVISLIGNHEIMNVEGNFMYVSYKDLKQFEGYRDSNSGIVYKDAIEGRKTAFRTGGEIAKFMACTRISCVVIGSNLFAHAGILPDLIEKFKITSVTDLDKINILVRKWLLGQITHNITDIINSSKVSPFWTRIFGNITPKTNDYNCVTHLEPVLKTLKIGNVIVGHTPQFYTHKEGINSTCDDKLWRVDIGLSKAFHPFDTIKTRKEIQVLEILNDNQFNIIK